jgi:hypothetical protein
MKNKCSQSTQQDFWLELSEPVKQIAADDTRDFQWDKETECRIVRRNLADIENKSYAYFKN